MAWSRLKALARCHPFICNSVAAAGIFGAADVTQQTIEGRPKYDVSNTCRMMVVGATVFGPFSHFWFPRMERFMPGTELPVVLKKMVLTTGLGGAFLNFMFYTVTSALEGKEDIFAEAREKWPRTYATAWLYWPFIQTISFRYIPLHLQPVYVNICAFLWTTILCAFKQRTFHTGNNGPLSS